MPSWWRTRLGLGLARERRPGPRTSRSRWRCPTGRRPGSCRTSPTSSYKAQSGNNVKLEADFIPWPNYYERLAASLTSGEQKYQMVVSDSQWLGAFVEGGYYMKINEFIDADPELQAIFEDLHPNLVAAYSTYPHKSDNYYGFPQMPDVLIIYYRDDLFCDESEQAAYQAKYGKKLPCDPSRDGRRRLGSGQDLRRVLPPRQGRAAGRPDRSTTTSTASPIRPGKAYDFTIMQVNAFIWQHGADIWDETKAPEGQAEGVVNSPEAVEALEHYLSLLRVHAAGGQDRHHGHLQDRRAVPRGQGRLDHPVDRLRRERDHARRPRRSPTRSRSRCIRACARPTARSRAGPTSAASRSCMTTWNDDEMVNEMVDFVKWWLSRGDPDRVRPARRPERPAERLRPARLRRLPALEPDLGASLDWQKDVWHVPTFFELLVQSQEEYDKAITGQQSAKETMDNIAAFQQELLEDEGLIE